MSAQGLEPMLRPIAKHWLPAVRDFSSHPTFATRSAASLCYTISTAGPPCCREPYLVFLSSAPYNYRQ